MVENFEDVFLKRIWDVYYQLEDSKKNSLNLLFLTLMIVILFWLVPSDAIKLPVIGNELPKFLTFTLAPFFIIFLTSKYLYVSALSLNVFIAYIKYFREFYKNTLDEKDISVSSLFNNFRIRNLSETLNLFLFPKRFNQKLGLSFNAFIHFITIIAHRIVTLLTFIIPFVFSLLTAYWFKINYQSKKVEEYIGIFILIAYAFSILILILFLISLIKGTKEA